MYVYNDCVYGKAYVADAQRVVGEELAVMPFNSSFQPVQVGVPRQCDDDKRITPHWLIH